MKKSFFAVVLISLGIFVGAAAPVSQKTTEELNPEYGTVELDFQPDCDVRKGELRILNFLLADNPAGRVDLGLTCGNGLSYLRFYLGDVASGKLNVGVYRPAELQAGQRHKIQFAWTPGQIFLAVDNKLIGSFAKRFSLHWGRSVQIGDAALPGKFSNLKFFPECRIENTGDFLRLSADRPGMIYKAGAPMQIAVTALHNNRLPLSGTVTLHYLRDDGKEMDREKLDLSKSGKGKKITLNEPGFLRVEALWEETGLKSELSAAFSPERIIAGRPEPEDFDAFWKNALLSAEALPRDVTLSRAAEFDTPEMECFRIRIPNVGSSAIYGFLGLPRNRARRYPGLVIVPGAGPGVSSPVEYFQPGVVNLLLNVHAYDSTRNPEKLPELYRQAYGSVDYCYHGMTGPKDYFFYRVCIGFHKALEWLTAHPVWDGKNLGVTGSSQGGGFSLILAGLHPRVTHLVANIPALGDHGASGAGRRPGWPNFSGRTGQTAPAWTTYYDTVYFARRIRARSVTVIVGFLDPVCPPGSVYAAFNAIPASGKRIINELDMRHEWPPSYGQAIQRMVEEMSKASEK